MAHGWNAICCPVDFSETSWLALEQAAGMVAGGNGRVVLLHVFDTAAAPANEMLVAPPELQQEALRESERKLQRFREQAERIAPGRIAAESVAGEPSAEIVRFAERGGVDLVVMGTHGRTGLRRLVLGSVAERVVRQAPCSVLVVRPTRFGTGPD